MVSKISHRSPGKSNRNLEQHVRFEVYTFPWCSAVPPITTEAAQERTSHGYPSYSRTHLVGDAGFAGGLRMVQRCTLDDPCGSAVRPGGRSWDFLWGGAKWCIEGKPSPRGFIHAFIDFYRLFMVIPCCSWFGRWHLFVQIIQHQASISPFKQPSKPTINLFPWAANQAVNTVRLCDQLWTYNMNQYYLNLFDKSQSISLWWKWKKQE